MNRILNREKAETEVSMNTQKIFGYIRVSTREQNEDRQRIALLEMGVPKHQIYMDKMSGKNFERPQYRKLLRKLDSNSILFIKSTVLGETTRISTNSGGLLPKKRKLIL